MFSRLGGAILGEATTLGGKQLRAAGLVAGNLVGVHESVLTSLVQRGDVAAGRSGKQFLITGACSGGDLFSQCLQTAFQLAVAQRAGLGFTDVFKCGFCVSHG